jgi:phosphoglycolate phosphatase
VRGLILFDIDGTLLRTGDRWHQQALVSAVEEVFRVPATLDGVPLAGMLDSQIVRLALEQQGVSEADIYRGLSDVMQAMERHYRGLVSGSERRSWLLPGVVELANRLSSDFALGVMTGNAKGVGRAKLELAGVDDLFPIGSYGDSADHRYQLVAVAAEVAAESYDREFVGDEMMIVGDTPRDIEAGRVAGTSVLAVATGRFSIDDLEPHEPDLLFEDLSEVEAVHEAISRMIFRRCADYRKHRPIW